MTEEMTDELSLMQTKLLSVQIELSLLTRITEEETIEEEMTEETTEDAHSGFNQFI
jgi:hypothetical protein